MFKKILLPLVLIVASATWITDVLYAGNPDRQGEAGAFELLLNPWARNGGFHAMNVATVRGVDGLFLNPAGIRPLGSTEIGFSQSRYLTQSGIKINAFGFSTNSGKNGSLGISINSMDFGQIPITTAEQPEGTGGTFSPSFINLGISYARTFEKVTVGATFKVVNQSISDLRATGACIDAGVRYVSDNFHFGLSLRNVGSKMRFGGEGLSFQQDNPDGTLDYKLTYDQRSASFEMPSQLNIGIGYDFKIGSKAKFTPVASFISNAFSRDELGVGGEFTLFEGFQIRGGYRAQVGNIAEGTDAQDVYTGLAGGASFDVPLRKGSQTKIGFDYSYLPSNVFGGTHNIGMRLNL
jgi:hypothetical protein